MQNWRDSVRQAPEEAQGDGDGLTDSTLRRPVLVPFLIGGVVGTAAQLNQAALSSVLVYGCFVAVAAVLTACLALKSIAYWRRASLAAGAAFCLAFAVCGLRAVAFVGEGLPASLEGRDLLVQGLVASMPQRNAGGLRFRFAVDSSALLIAPADTLANPASAPEEKVGVDNTLAVPPLVYLGWYGDPGGTAVPDVKPGQRWQVVVRLKAPHGNSNPHGFDYELWLWEQGLQATGYVRTGRNRPPRLLAQTAWHPVESARQAVREAIYLAVPERRTAGIIAALVVGDQAAIERADWDVFRAAGVAHLMSISGLHVTLFAWLAAALIGWLWRRSTRLCLWLPTPHAALVGGVLLAAGYALFSGWGVPAQRTVLMLATVAGLRWHGSRWPWPLVWLVAVAVVLVWDPWALLQAGFWLSFVAVLFASDVGGPGRAAGATTSVGHRWLVPLRKLLREQAVVTLALTPLTLLLFGQLSVVGLLANLFAIPWVTLVVTPLAMLGVVWAPLWALCTWCLQGLVLALQALVAVPFATYSVATPPLWIGASGLLGGAVLVLRLPWAVRLLGLPLLLPVVLWQAPRPGVGQFEVLAADVGQGTAVLVRTAQHSLLYDAGPRFGAESDAGHRVLVPLLRALDERLDLLILSHRDLDHTGGAAAVLAMQPQATLLSSIEPGHALQAIKPAQRCLAGQRWQWDGVDFEVLHPTPAHYERAASGQLKPNGLSCVLRVSNAQNSALLTGDIEQAQETELLAKTPAALLKTDLLLVPHHGSKTSSSVLFLEAAHPQWAVVQSGYRNRFGHPAPAVVARYAAQRVNLLDSAHCGALTWDSVAPQQAQCQRQNEPRYWQHRVPNAN